MTGRLPQPKGKQREVLVLPAQGHHVVLGTAGSGKTTLAIHRALYLAHPNTDHHGRTLLVTFNKCLVAYLRDMVGQVPRLVDVVNYHRFARGYLASQGAMRWNCISGPEEVSRFSEQAVAEALAAGATAPALRKPTELLVEEFRWLAQHGIATPQQYVDVDRVGRAGTRITRAERPEVFDTYLRYKAIRTAAGKDYDWDDLGSAVIDRFAADNGGRRYRHVVIDEGQDFSPVMLRSLAAAVPADGSLTFFGDMAQQIYGNKMSWRSAGLNIGAVWNFEENYRNTRQVARLALALAKMPHFSDDPDLVDPKSPTADGPLPALVSLKSEADELALVAGLARRAGAKQTVAVLFRDREAEAGLEAHIPSGMTRLHGDLRDWPSGNGIFYGTYHAAKGLEFDMVLLPFVSAARLPHPPDVSTFGFDDVAVKDSALLYVAITRAKSNLVLTHSGPVTSLLPTGASLYQRSSR